MEAQFDHNQSLENIILELVEEKRTTNLLDELIADEVDSEQVTITRAGANFGHGS